MLELINNIWVFYTQLMKESPVIAGAFSLYGMGIITYLIRGVPAKIYQIIVSQITTTLILTNAGADANEINFQNFGVWYNSLKYGKFSRTLSFSGAGRGSSSAKLQPGLGRHFFFFKSRLFIFKISRLASTGTSKEKEEIIITMFGRKHQVMEDLIEQFRYKDNAGEISVYKWEEDYWARTANVTKKPKTHVVVEETLKNKIFKAIDSFRNNEVWYREKYIPYKETIVFHGLPGTGKTSLINMLASHYNANIYLMSPMDLSSSRCRNALHEIPKGSFCVVEDVDSNPALAARGTVTQKVKDKKAETATEKETDSPRIEVWDNRPKDTLGALMDDLGSSFLSEVLNTLDGIVTLDGVLIFMTTNDYESLDEAFKRKGRVDHAFEIPYLTNKEIHEYLELMYPPDEYAEVKNNYHFTDMPGCDVQDYFKQNKFNLHGFITDTLKDQKCTKVFSSQLKGPMGLVKQA